MTTDVLLTDTFGSFRTKTNELIAMTQVSGMDNYIKVLDAINSTSNTTGSITTAGGLGVSKSVTVGGDLTVYGDATISGNLTFGDAATDQITFSADINSNIIPNANITFDLGNSTMSWANVYTRDIILNGTQITATASELNILDGITANVAELNTLDGITATVAELNLLAGVTDISTQGELDARVLVATTAAQSIGTGDSPTFVGTTLTSIINSTSNTTGSITTAGGLGVSKSVTVGGDLTVYGDATISGNLTFGDAATDQITFSADINSNIIPNANITFDLGNSTMSWANVYTRDIILNGTQITATASELNILDGITANVAELNTLDGITATVAELNLLAGVTANTAELNYNDITALGTAEVSKVVTSDGSGNITFVNSTNDIDIASHDGTNGLKLGGTLVTKTATELNAMVSSEEATAVAVSMAIALG